MNGTRFGQRLELLSVADIRAISSALATECASPAGEIATTRAVLVVEQTLRLHHKLHDAADAAIAAAVAVQAAARRAGVALPDRDVTRVARSAAQLARALVVEGRAADDATRTLACAWRDAGVEVEAGLQLA